MKAKAKNIVDLCYLMLYNSNRINGLKGMKL